MDFHFTPQEEAFRHELRTWLEANRPADYDPEKFAWEMDADERFRCQLEWQKRLYEGGWIGVHWPREYGGRGATLIEQLIFHEEMERVQAPPPANVLGLLMAGPVIMHWGTEEQKKRYLPRILSGEEIWCEGLSEPGAGSDLASLQTRAAEDGDVFVVNGQKVWTSWAHRAQFCQLFVRTNPEAPKHQGMACLIVDMRTPGITVRPLVQISGDAEFNEVFFENVRVPKANLIGGKDQGWQVLVTTLMFERSGIGLDLPVDSTFHQLCTLVRRVQLNGVPANQDAMVRQQIAQFAIECKAIRYNVLRHLTRRLKGNPPGPEGSIGKLAGSELGVRMAAFASQLLGPYGSLALGEPRAVERGKWARIALGARSLTIAGGTSEVQRNIIGERVLGLPKG
ncbi:MAG: acyl-CoA dehydrogenase family protein [Candidatus Binatia bacterium]|nr:acyl-CoA dehydrogenase family protein [Candidatus Binatia bacterium]